MPSVRLVAGLGNPGREHLATRHNAGFWFADGLASRLGVAFRTEGRFHGQLAKADGDLRLLKPGTYMNLSGRSVSSVADITMMRRSGRVVRWSWRARPSVMSP